MSLVLLVAEDHLIVSREHSGSTCVVSFSGEIDCSNHLLLASVLAESDDCRADNVMIDLTALDFTDVRGADLFALAFAEAEARRVDMLFAGGSKMVEIVFEIVGLPLLRRND